VTGVRRRRGPIDGARIIPPVRSIDRYAQGDESARIVASMTRIPDEELLRIARERPEAIATFYDRFERPVLAFFRRRVIDPQTALDLTAETFAQVVLETRDGVRVDDAASWLFAITRSKLSHYDRLGAVESRARRRVGLGPVHAPAERLELLDPTEDDLALEAVWSVLRGLAVRAPDRGAQNGTAPTTIVPELRSELGDAMALHVRL
jgi:DNA-directed RNA polymerase specialized sigma24 family protein